MSDYSLFDRRDFIKLGASAAAIAALSPGLANAKPAANVFASRFGVSNDELRRTLEAALSKGGDFADLFFQNRTRTMIALEDDKVSKAQTFVDLGVGVRVVKGEAIGYAFTESLEPESLKRAAQTAAAIAEGSSGKKVAPFKVGSKGKFYPLTTNYADVGVAQKTKLLERVNQGLKAKDKRVGSTNITFLDEENEVLVVTSDGQVFTDFQPMTRLTASCVAEQNGRRETGAYNVSARDSMAFYSDERVQRLVDECVRRTVLMFEAETPKGGEMPVVLGAGAGGILLHEAIGHGMEADFNRKEISTYATSLNKPVAEKFVNIVDDATLVNARGSINVDDEGSAASRTGLVVDGVLASYLHDKISAAHYKVKPTGSGRRESYRHTIQPRMRSTYMLNGPHKKEEIIAAVKHGIYCESFSNGQVSIGSGDFTFFVKTGYMIEDGKLGRPIKDVNIIGNGPQTLAKVSMVADDLVIDEGGWTCGKNGQSVPVSQGMPTALVKGMTVGGKA